METNEFEWSNEFDFYGEGEDQRGFDSLPDTGAGSLEEIDGTQLSISYSSLSGCTRGPTPSSSTAETTLSSRGDNRHVGSQERAPDH